MNVYHGSYMFTEEIDLSKSVPDKDFGKGFYVTKFYRHVESWAKIIGRKHKTEGFVTEFIFYDTEFTERLCNVKRFDAYNGEWLDFVIENRNPFGKTHNYDIVEGTVANDEVQNRIGSYLDGTISKIDFLEELKWHENTHQICFCTLKSLLTLQLTNRKKVSFLSNTGEPIVEKLVTDFNLDEQTAADKFFTSNVFSKLAKKEIEKNRLRAIGAARIDFQRQYTLMRISQIIETVEDFAPLDLQENYDNSGLQVGDTSQKVKGILLCLDVTEDVLEEAIELDCNLIISHHPLLFKPIKKLTGRTYIERCVTKACKHDLVIYAAHTNLDNAFGGLNFYMAEKLGLQNLRILSPKKDGLLKLVTFVPEAHAETVRDALFGAGAGCIGNYDSCSFNVPGAGTFRAGEHTHPFAGIRHELHVEPEIRIETIVPAHKKSSVLRTLLAVHPYEEPAYDFHPLVNEWNRAGTGVVGELPYPEEEEAFLQRLKTIFKLKSIRHSFPTGKEIREVALCGGNGSFLIPDAINYGADVFITGEAKYNDFYDVEKKILLMVIGHYESEIISKELFYDVITKKITNFAVHFSTMNPNPVNYL